MLFAVLEKKNRKIIEDNRNCRCLLICLHPLGHDTWLLVSCGSITRRHRGTSDAADARIDARIESDEDDDEEDDDDEDEDADSTPTYAPGSRSSMYRRSENMSAARVMASGRDARASMGSCAHRETSFLSAGMQMESMMGAYIIGIEQHHCLGKNVADTRTDFLLLFLEKTNDCYNYCYC